MRRGLFVAVAVLLAFHDALTARFVSDDYHYVLQNQALRVSAIPGLFLHGYDSGNATFYRPLSTATFAVDRALFGVWALPFHAENLLWHLLVALVLLAILRRLFSEEGALVGALVFALHPLHVEAVTCVVGRTELMAAAFSLLGVLAWLTGRTRSALVCALFALWCKESGLACAPLAVLLDGWSTRPWRSALRRGLWLVIPIAVYAGLRFVALRDAVLPAPDPLFVTADPASAFATVVGVLGRDLRLLVVPSPLIADYSWAAIEPASSLLSPAPLASLIAIVSLGVLAFATRRRAPFVWLSLAIIGIALLPVSNLVVHIGVLLAERLLYAPSLGVAFLVAGAYGLTGASLRSKRLVAGSVLVVALALCLQRNLDWQTPLSLWTDTVEKQPRSALAHANLASALETVGDHAGALRELRIAVSIAPLRPDYSEALKQAEQAPQP